MITHMVNSTLKLRYCHANIFTVNTFSIFRQKMIFDKIEIYSFSILFHHIYSFSLEVADC